MALNERPQRASVPPATPAANRPRLLYVEDEDINWEVTLMHLRASFQVERARDAEEAMRRIAGASYSAVLMDIQLAKSGLNGIELTQALRGTFVGELPDYARGVLRPDLPIVFLTAYSARYNRAELQAMGGTDLIVKPIDFVQLRAVLAQIVQG